MNQLWQRYKEWIAPPKVPGDAEQARLAALMNRVFLMFIHMFTVLAVVGPFIFPVWYATWIALALLVIVWRMIRVLLERGYLRQLSMGLVLIFWVIITGTLHMSGGMEDNPNAFSYATVVLLAGMFLGGRSGLITAIASIISLGLILFLGETGRLPAPRPDNTEIDEFFITTSNLMMVALFTFINWRSEREARQKEHILAEEAIRANEYKTELVGRVSHELRTPLSAVIGLADMLRSGAMGEVSLEQKNILQKIIFNTDYLQHLVSELLEQSQINSGKLLIRQETFSPRELARRIGAALEPDATAKGLTLRFEGADSLPEVLIGDTHRLEEIFANLIGNAIKFTDHGSIVATASLPDEKHWQVKVSDTGIGIPPESVEKIFEPFHQLGHTTITRKQGGVGLGLSITRQLIEMMGGSIHVESHPGQGSVFTVTLPIIQHSKEMHS